MKNFPLRLAMLASVLTLFPLMAHADPGGHGHHKHKDKGDHRIVAEERPAHIVIEQRDRIIIRDYIREDYHRHCPPGLAKKHNGCQPPGQAKKRYAIGHTLPADVIFVPAPTVIVERLEPVPVGYRYVQVDEDILLINEASHKIIDAVTLISAVGN